MYAKVASGTICGYEVLPTEVEIHLGGGLPGFNLVGLPDSAVSESRERVRAALSNQGWPFPARKITVNLAPADMRKEGTGLDLPLALGLLAVMNIIPQDHVANYLFFGEVSLDGKLRHTRGVLPMALLAHQQSAKGLVVPRENLKEALGVPGVNILAFDSLSELVTSFQQGKMEAMRGQHSHDLTSTNLPQGYIDLRDIKGQWQAKRALEIAAAGGHNLLFWGPPGSGKTMLAQALPGLLPRLSYAEALEVTKIYSIKGLITANQGLLFDPPFRQPHHTCSDVALIGGGRIPMPGEVTLAHHGILFLDELPEYSKKALETLREPLSIGRVSISRAARHATFPARFQLVAAMNPCPCGYLTDPQRECLCSPQRISNYQQKVSGPLLDRIDMQLSVPRLSPTELDEQVSGEDTTTVRARVLAARNRQMERNADNGKIGDNPGDGMNLLNAHQTPAQLRRNCVLDRESQKLLRQAAEKFHLSARGYDKILRISRTLADLAGSDAIGVHHVAEAIHYRHPPETRLIG